MFVCQSINNRFALRSCLIKYQSFNHAYDKWSERQITRNQFKQVSIFFIVSQRHFFGGILSFSEYFESIWTKKSIAKRARKKYGYDVYLGMYGKVETSHSHVLHLFLVNLLRGNSGQWTLCEWMVWCIQTWAGRHIHFQRDNEYVALNKLFRHGQEMPYFSCSGPISWVFSWRHTANEMKSACLNDSLRRMTQMETSLLRKMTVCNLKWSRQCLATSNHNIEKCIYAIIELNQLNK